MNKTAAALVIKFMATLLGCQTKQTKKEEHASVETIPIVKNFGNPQKTGCRISPDGRFYAYRGRKTPFLAGPLFGSGAFFFW